MHGRIFRAFPLGPFTIIPEGDSATTGIPVILGRKGAFGSGEHETTVACLEELAKVAGISGATVLDLGSGTGILAICRGPARRRLHRGPRQRLARGHLLR